MFHSAGYFRGVRCPFFEHGLCHRPHCHYKHSKPGSAAKPAVKPLLKIRAKLHKSYQTGSTESLQSQEPVKPDDSIHTASVGPGSDGTEQTLADGENKNSSKELLKAVPDVVEAIGKITNYFGSTNTPEGECSQTFDKLDHASVEVGQTSVAIETHGLGVVKDVSAVPSESCEENRGGITDHYDNIGVGGEALMRETQSCTTIGGLSKVDIGRLAGEIAEKLSSNSGAAPDRHVEAEVPSYAPEKCIDNAVVYSREANKDSSQKQTSPVELGLPPLSGSDKISKLKDILVTEKEIFGGPVSEDELCREDNDQPISGEGALSAKADDCAGDNDSADCGMSDRAGDDGDCIGDELIGANSVTDANSVTGASSDPAIDRSLTEEEMMEEFKKITSLSEEKTAVLKRKLKQSVRDEDVEVPAKKRRVAHPQAETIGVREPARVIPSKHKITDSNFSSMVTEGGLYMGKKRVANQQSTSSASMKRPRLALNANAKIATKVRQRYLDAFIDEHMKMDIPPQEAYKKALEEEKELFENSKNSRSSYLNKSYNVLKQLRARVEQYVTEQRRISDKRVQQLKESPPQVLVKRVVPSIKAGSEKRNDSGDEGKKIKKGKSKVKVSSEQGGWRMLDAELQANFSPFEKSESSVKSNNSGKRKSKECQQKVRTHGDDYKFATIEQWSHADKPNSLYSCHHTSAFDDSHSNTTDNIFTTSKFYSDKNKTKSSSSIENSPSVRTKSFLSKDPPSDNRIGGIERLKLSSKDGKLRPITASGQFTPEFPNKSVSDVKLNSSPDVTAKTKGKDGMCGLKHSNRHKEKASKKLIVTPATSLSCGQSRVSEVDLRSSDKEVERDSNKMAVSVKGHKVKDYAPVTVGGVTMKEDSRDDLEEKTLAMMRISRHELANLRKKKKVNAKSKDETASHADNPQFYEGEDLNQEAFESDHFIHAQSTRQRGMLSPELVDLTSDLFGSDSEDSVCVLSDSQSPTHGSTVSKEPQIPAENISRRKCPKVVSRPSQAQRGPGTDSESSDLDVFICSSTQRDPEMHSDSNSNFPPFSPHRSTTRSDSPNDILFLFSGESDNELPSGKHRQRCQITSSSAEEGDLMGMSFEDALTSYETTRVKKKGKKHGRKNFQSSLFKADKKDGMKKRGDKGRSRWSPDDRDHTCAHKNSCHESTLTGKPSGEITTGPRNVLLKKVPSLKLVKANISISRQSSKSDASSSPDPSTTSHDHATMSCDSVSVSSHHPVTMSHDSTTDRPVIQKEGKGKGKARRGSVSSPPSHHPCGPYINLSRLSLELKQAATLSSHSSHKKPTDHKSISCRKEVRLPHTTNKKDAEKVKTGSSKHSRGRGTEQVKGNRLHSKEVRGFKERSREKVVGSSSKSEVRGTKGKGREGQVSTSSSHSGENYCEGKASVATHQIRTTNFAVFKKKEVPSLTSELFYAQMWKYVLREDQLHDCGYPRPTSEPGVAEINREGDTVGKITPVGPNAMRHECCRCHKMFTIYNNGQYQTVESCSYHYGKAYKYKEYGEGMVSKYSCCQERSGSSGCQLAKLHVTAGEALSRVPGYVETQPIAGDDPHQRVYALDCEMCYTTIGLELTRISVIDMNLKAVYESLVKPSHTIVDYNTRFSGLTAQDFLNVEKTLSQVQDDLLHLFSSETILIGHSLESDLKALKLIHSRIVDTALVFPHKLGLPYKKALKTLAKDILQKFIQNEVDDGHDSLEDSKACMELMIWKVKGDLKALCRRRSGSDK